jgi:hypothetical protein
MRLHKRQPAEIPKSSSCWDIVFRKVVLICVILYGRLCDGHLCRDKVVGQAIFVNLARGEQKI